MDRSRAGIRASIALGLLVLVLGAGFGCGEDSDAGGSTGGGGEKASGGWALGHWQGELQQKGLKPFRVWATVASLEGASGNRVRYSGLDCRGRWTPLGGEAGAYRFREEITSGRSDKCKGVGVVTLRRAPGSRALYVFRGGGVESQGVLRHGPASGS
jgi:hypothetical protein